MKRRFDYLIILIMGLVSHGLLLLSDGIFWDDWLWFTSLSGKDYFLIYRVAMQRGIPTDFYFWLTYTLFPDVIFGQRLLVFILIIFSAIVVYWICQTTGMVSRFESLMIAVITICFPAFQTWVLIATSQYVFYYFLFLLATLIALKMKNLSGIKTIGFRAISLLLFFLSFALNSLLAFYFGFLLLVFFYSRKQKLEYQTSILDFITHHLDFVLLPFVYLIIKTTLFPQYGLYANYNQFTFSINGYATSTANFLSNGIYNQIGSAIQKVVELPFIWLSLLVILYLILRISKLEMVPVFDNTASPGSILNFGLLLLGLGILPYVAVGLAPTEHGWDTRHTLLLSLPMGLIIVAAIRILFAKPNGPLNWVGWLFFSSLLFGFTSLVISEYIGLQQRWIKDRSVMVALARMDEAQRYSIYWVDDEFPLNWNQTYQFYEWSSMFKQVWGDEKRVGLPQSTYDEWFITEGYIEKFRSYNFNNIDPYGCQAILVIRPGPKPIGSFTTILNYYYYRLFQPNEMNAFLENFVRVDITPYPSDVAKNCVH